MTSELDEGRWTAALWSAGRGETKIQVLFVFIRLDLVLLRGFLAAQHAGVLSNASAEVHVHYLSSFIYTINGKNWLELTS